MTSHDHFDICIVGAGVIGLALAQKISSHPVLKKYSQLLVEKHKNFGQETSSRNSEVIHAGIYYPQDSLKARLCVAGKTQLYRYCETRDIPHRRIGKLIIAGGEQSSSLEALLRRAERNGVDDMRMVERKELNRLEQAVRADCALFSPSSGIIDSHSFMQSLLNEAEGNGALYAPLTEVIAAHPENNRYIIECLCQETLYRFSCNYLVNAAGLFAQETAAKIEGFPDTEIPEQMLVKGTYFSLQGASPFSHLIYPVPEKNLKGLGVHVTLDMGGQAKFGPDTEPVSGLDYDVDVSREQSFRKVIAHYFPDIENRRLSPAYSGIRPKLKSADGVGDFTIQSGAPLGFPGLVQLFGIESPGLTASLAIADEVVDILVEAT